ncbi:MAG: WhiB family transcriptional regulator [Actinomycetota bacterium]|nr:WhiB family transcriptional regulator [Actinomycetota bacterium]
MRSVSWAAEAACRGSKGSLFYSDCETEERKAKAICSLCCVRIQCLEFALSSREPDGIWGGLNPRQRRRIIRERESVSVSILVGSH